MNGALRRGPGSTFRVSETSEGWQVTHGETVYGDFGTRGEAVRAACFGARTQDRRGGRSEVRVMPGDEREPPYEPHFGE